MEPRFAGGDCFRCSAQNLLSHFGARFPEPAGSASPAEGSDIEENYALIMARIFSFLVAVVHIFPTLASIYVN